MKYCKLLGQEIFISAWKECKWIIDGETITHFHSFFLIFNGLRKKQFTHNYYQKLPKTYLVVLEVYPTTVWPHSALHWLPFRDDDSVVLHTLFHFCYSFFLFPLFSSVVLFDRYDDQKCWSKRERKREQSIYVNNWANVMDHIRYTVVFERVI